jgi:hypothetical protein
MTSPSEIALLSESPEEFVNISIDVIDKQRSCTMKTAAAKLIETLSDFIDGCTSLISHLCFDLMMISLTEKNQYFVNKLVTGFPGIFNYFLALKDESRLENSFMVLSVLCYVIPKRMDLMLKFSGIQIIVY